METEGELEIKLRLHEELELEEHELFEPKTEITEADMLGGCTDAQEIPFAKLADQIDHADPIANIFEQLKELEEKVSQCLQNQDLLFQVIRRVTSLEENMEQFKKAATPKTIADIDTKGNPFPLSLIDNCSIKSNIPTSPVNNCNEMETEDFESNNFESDNDNDWQPPHSDTKPDLTIDNFTVKTRSSGRTRTTRSTSIINANAQMDLSDQSDGDSNLDEDWQPTQPETESEFIALTSEMEANPKELSTPASIPKPTHKRQCKDLKCALCPAEFSEKHKLARHHLIHAAGLDFRCVAGCNIQFGNLEDLNEHSHNLHDENKTCKICKKVLRNPSDVPIHLRNEHAIDEPYNCIRCKRSYEKKDDLLRHEIKHHGASKIKGIGCKICSTKFQNTSKLYKHYQLKHLDFLRAYKCKFCKDAFFKPELLAYHYGERHPVITDLTPSTADDPEDPSSEFRCSECQVLLTSQQNLTKHLCNVHGIGESVVRCGLCQKNFNSTNKVRIHQLEVHGQRIIGTKLENVEYPCQHCKKIFYKKKVLNLHIPRCLGLKLFQCDICGLSLASKNGLSGHIKNMHEGQTRQTSQGQEKVLCPECGKEIRRYYLTSHLKTHQEEAAFNCEICGHPYAHRTDLLAHMETHTGVKNLSCTFCDKKFSHQRTLKIHIKTHTTGKNHKCTSCGKAFRLKSSLRIHFRTHTGEKLFGCELCGKRYRQDQGLKIHMRAHERGKGRSLYLKPDDKDKDKDVCEKSSDLHEDTDAVCANDNEELMS